MQERRFGSEQRRLRVWDVPAGKQAGPAGSGRAQPGGGPVFVVVHGWGGGSRLYRRLTRELAPHGRVLVFDLPGFTDVPRPSEPMGIGGFARVANGTLAELGVDEPVLVGHSMGAQVVVEMVHQQPRLGGRVVLVAPVVPASLRSLRAAALTFMRNSLHERPGAAALSVLGYLSSGVRWPMRVLPSVLGYPVERRIEALAGRLEVVRGERDVMCPQDWSELLAARSSAEARIHVVPGAAHQVVVDDARAVASAALRVAGIAGADS